MLRQLFVYVIMAVFMQDTYCYNKPFFQASSQFFTLRNLTSFIHLMPKWPLSSTQQLQFSFRTEQPNGLLMYHGINSTESLQHGLYIILQNGRLKVIYVIDDEATTDSFYIGKGLNNDKWHSVSLTIQSATSKLSLALGKSKKTISLPSLTKYLKHISNDTSVSLNVYFGGTDLSHVWNQPYSYGQFIGCFGNITLNKSVSFLTIADFDRYNEINNGCLDLCSTETKCKHNSRCINHYTETSCDCFGTDSEGSTCEKKGLQMISLLGSSYLSHKIYDWSSHAHSETNKLSITFKAYFPNSVLFFASGKEPHNNYFMAVILEDSILFEVCIGDKVLNTTFSDLCLGSWHNFTMLHRGKKIKLIFDEATRILSNDDIHHHRYIDVDLYIGGLPNILNGSVMQNNFIGCLKGVYFNHKDILYFIQSGEPSVRYHGTYPVQYNCKTVRFIPITFPFMKSQLQLQVMPTNYSQVAFEFKTNKKDTLLVSGYAKSTDSIGTWQVQLQNKDIVLRLEIGSNITLHLATKSLLSDNHWHHVSLSCNRNIVKLEVDKKYRLTHNYQFNVNFEKSVVFGGEIQNTSTGFIGCIQNVHFNEKWMDSRMLMKTALVKNEVYLDNCQSVDPCSNNMHCEHGGRCYVDSGKTYCNCSGTGYTGNTCHFSKYKRSCQELYLVGYRKSTVYKIDVDRNGPLPPGHVLCEMEDGNIITKIDSNVIPEMIVRTRDMEDYYIDVSYNDFSPVMLQYLVWMSKYCSQHIRYECFKVPLGLNSNTWLQSASGELLKTLVTSEADYCSCGDTPTCIDNKNQCNCDSKRNDWTSDNGLLTDPKHLPIIRIYIIQPKNFPKDGEAHLSLDALKCVEEDIQLYVISFTSHESFLQLPTWRKGDMSFSFRTASVQAVLLYQHSLYINHSYFHIFLINDFTLSFEFTANNNPYIINVTSRYALNNGEWQQVWVEYDIHHIRFTVNQDSAMIDLAENEFIGPFEGPLYVGGVPKYQMESSQLQNGFIGCFRGLVVDDEIINLHRYLNSRTSEILQSCSASCSSNLCQNGAKCLELWGAFECKCLNPVAHSGKFCENNINTNAVTFFDSYSFSHYTKEGIEHHPVLNQNIILNFHTYEEEALLLYAVDHLHNFVQLHWEKGRRVVFSFNSLHTIVQDYIEVSVFSRGKPIQVQVFRTLDKTILVSSGENKTIDFPIKFLESYYQNPWNKSSNLVPYIEIFLGGIPRGMASNITGLVGCLQGLKIGNQHYDLQHYFTASSKDAVRFGCQTSCNVNSCFNNGLCIELWKENKTKCDCSLTSYIGDDCQKDVGGKFDGKSFLSYALNISGTSLNFFKIKFAISINHIANSSRNQHLLHIQFDQRSYISIEVTPAGFLYIEEIHNSSVKTIFIETEIRVIDGYRHWIYYTRNVMDTHILIDGKECFIEKETIAMETYLGYSNYSSITIGGMNTSGIIFPQNNFSGCLSNVIVTFNSFEAKPLEAAFGYQKGTIQHVTKIGKVVESQCANFADMKNLEVADKESPFKTLGNDWKPGPPVIVPYAFELPNEQAEFLEAIKSTSARVAICMTVFLFIVLTSLFVYIWHLQKRHKRQQFEEEAAVFFKARKPHSPTKIVSFEGGENDYLKECITLHEMPEFDDLQTQTYINNMKGNDFNYPTSKYSPKYHRIDVSGHKEFEW